MRVVPIRYTATIAAASRFYRARAQLRPVIERRTPRSPRQKTL